MLAPRFAVAAKGTTAMLFTGIIAALIARFTDDPARHLPPPSSDAPRDRDEEKPTTDSVDPLTRRH